MIKRWVHAVIALNAENQPVGVIYMEDNVKPYPYLKPPTRATQSVRNTPKQARVPPNRDEVIKKYQGSV